MSDLMQRTLNGVQNWCGEIGLNVNANKKSIVVFTKWRVFSPLNSLTLII
jgi:hypothetical protein